MPVCGDCIAKLRGIHLGICCSLCSEPMGYEPVYAPNDGHLCGQCAEMRPAFVRATAFGAYEQMGRVLRLFKFEGVRSLEVPLGEMLAEAIVAQAEGMPERMLVVPVPLFGRRHRNYNQSELLARCAVRAVNRLHPEWVMDVAPRCLKRVHHRESHYRLSPEERRENVRGAFRVQGDVRGQHVLLVDDVYTTGATVTECTEMLLAAGAASVRVVTLARAGTQIPVLWTPRTAAMVSTEYQVQNSFGSFENPTLRH